MLTLFLTAIWGFYAGKDRYNYESEDFRTRAVFISENAQKRSIFVLNAILSSVSRISCVCLLEKRPILNIDVNILCYIGLL